MYEYMTRTWILCVAQDSTEQEQPYYTGEQKQHLYWTQDNQLAAGEWLKHCNAALVDARDEENIREAL